jgi:hypothetical protein
MSKGAHKTRTVINITPENVSVDPRTAVSRNNKKHETVQVFYLKKSAA